MKLKITSFVLALMLILSIAPVAADVTATPLWGYDNVGGFKEGRAQVEKDGKYGFIDTSGNLVVPCVYENLSDFSEGIARVDSNNEQLFIDTVGNWLFRTNYLYVHDFSDGMARVMSQDGYYGYIDKTGAEVIPCIYGGALDFNYGVAPVLKSDYVYDIIDKSGNVIFTCSYDSITSFYDGLAKVNVQGRNAFIDTAGNQITPFYDSAEAFSGGMASVYIDRKRGFINTSGQLVVPNIYSSVDNYVNGYGFGYKDGIYSCLDTAGNVLFDLPAGSSPSGFYGDYSSCYDRNTEQRGVIDKAGNFVIPYGTYDWIYPYFYGNTGVGQIGDTYYLLTIDNSPEVGVILNGTRLSFTKPPKIVDGRTIVPLRTIFEAMEAKVDWDDATQSITVSRGSDVISFQIGNNVMTRNGETIVLDVPPQLLVDTTFVPVRAISEAFSYNVDWDDVNYDVIINE